MGLGEWTSEGRVLYSNGMEWTSEGRVLYSNGIECCVVLGWRALIKITPYDIGRVDFRGKAAV